MRAFIVVFIVVYLFSACIPNPTNDECHKQQDCLSCTESFCSWCGPSPGWTNQDLAGKRCYAKGHEPAFCDPPQHFAFCYAGPTVPISNRELKRLTRDGGTDGPAVRK